MIQRRHFLQAAALSGLGWGPLGAYASDDKPVKWVLGFAAGGGTDVLARALAPRVGKLLGVPVIVENRPGANGNVAAEVVARAAPDGLTFLYNTSSLVTSPALYPKVPFDPIKDFVPVCPIGNVPLLLVAGANFAPANLAEFIAYAKANSGRLTYASAGNGNVTHLSNLLFQQAVGFKAIHVPYKGGGPALNDVLAGHVDFYMDTSNTAAPFVRKGLLKAYASTGLNRLTSLPDVPTVAESAVPRFDTGSWTGLVGPANTPKEMIAKMNAAVNAVQRDPAVASTFALQETEIRAGTAQAYGTFLRSEMERWGGLIRAHGVRID